MCSVAVPHLSECSSYEGREASSYKNDIKCNLINECCMEQKLS